MSRAPTAQVESPMTHILMLARVLDAGGIERDVSKYARHLVTKGFQPHVGCFNPGGMRWREIEAAGIPVLYVPVYSFRSASAIRGARILQQYIAAHQIRLIHGFDPPSSVYAGPLARFLGVPVLSSQVSYRALCNLQTRMFLSLIDRIATGIFVNCEAMADHVRNDWKVPANKIHICYNGFEPEEFHPHGRKRPEALSDASIVIGTVALLRPEKNLELLVEAFAKLLQVDPRACLLFVGSGPVRTGLERRMLELGIREACVFQDTVERPADWMRAIDIFVLPSRSEAFSNSLLEATACGCCPVASRVGGSPELVAHRQRGLLFESGNVQELTAVLIELATRPWLRQALADEAASFVREHLTMEIAAARLAGIYKRVLGMHVDPERGEEFVPLPKSAERSVHKSKVPGMAGE